MQTVRVSMKYNGYHSPAPRKFGFPGVEHTLFLRVHITPNTDVGNNDYKWDTNKKRFPSD
jgi:hypothetical protein